MKYTKSEIAASLMLMLILVGVIILCFTWDYGEPRPSEYERRIHLYKKMYGGDILTVEEALWLDDFNARHHIPANRYW